MSDEQLELDLGGGSQPSPPVHISGHFQSRLRGDVAGNITLGDPPRPWWHGPFDRGRLLALRVIQWGGGKLLIELLRPGSATGR